MLAGFGTPPAVAAGPCDQGCVKLTVRGSTGASYSRTLSLATILSVSDRGRTSYTVKNGASSDTYDAPGADQTTSLRRVLVRLLHVSPDAGTSVTITRPSGGSFTLSGTDLAEPGSAGYPFQDGPPVFTSLGRDRQVTFIRPQRSDDDPNGQDFLVATELDGTVTIAGQILAPSVSASPSTTTPDSPVTLDATAGGATGTVSYSWDFDDGTADTTLGSSTSHAWSSASTYQVTVTVQGDNGTGVATTEVSVHNEDTTKPGPPGGGGGATDGPRTGGPGSGNQSGGTPGKGGKGGTGRGGPGARGTGTTGTNGTSTGGTTGSTTAGTSAAATKARRAIEKARSQRDGKSKPQDTATGGQQVSGVLLDAEAASAVTVPSGSSPRVASVTTRPATEIPADRRWLLAGVPLLLLLLGGVRQTRWLTRRVPELPWRTS